MRRWVLLLVALALAAGSFPLMLAAPAGAAGSCPCIVVTVAGSSAPPVSFGYAEFQGWIDQSASAQTFLERRQPGPAAPIFDADLPAGVSIATLLQMASINPASVTFLQIPGQNGYVSTLTNPEVQPDATATPSPFISDQFPTIAPIGGYSFGYARPLLSSDPPDSDPDHSDPNDTNARDYFQTSPGSDLDITVFTQGQLLHPTVQVLTAVPAVGKPVAFAANLASGEAPSDPTYRWDFYDGPPGAAGQKTSHSYPAAGTYYVAVAVEGGVGTADASYGMSPPVLVTVGKAPKPAGGGGAGGGGNKKHPVVGPNKGKGHHPGGVTGKTPSTKPTTSRNAPTTSRTAPTTEPTATPTGGADPAAPPDGSSTPTASRGTPLRDRGTSPPATGAEFGAIVHGVVIGGAPQPVVATTRATTPPATAPSARRATSTPFDARLLWWLLLPLLLGLGVLGEIRRPGPRRTPPA